MICYTSVNIVSDHSVCTSQGAQKIQPCDQKMWVIATALTAEFIVLLDCEVGHLQSTVLLVCLFHQSSKGVNHKATQGGHVTHFRWFTEQKHLN